MRKIFLSLIVSLTVIGILGTVSFVKADDSAPNTAFWIKDNKIHCLSVINPEDLNSDYFFLFDYSPNTGETLGKPWAIVEKGKCYEIDDEEGILYRVQIISGNERQQYSNYTKYKPTDNITANENIVRMWPYEYIGLGITSPTYIPFTGITANSLFPTKYDFGASVTFFYSTMSEFDQNLLSDETFSEIDRLYSSLAEELENTIRLCDNRIRVEHQLSVSQEYNNVSEENIIWRLNNNKDFVFDAGKELDPLAAIELIGCKTAFGEYTNSHKQDFDTIDRLSQELVDKYQIEVNIAEKYGPIAPIEKRDDSSIEKILAFTSNNEPSNNVNNATATTDQEVTATLPDEPTPQKKLDLLLNSENPLMRIYVFLPIIAIIGIIVFLFLKKR